METLLRFKRAASRVDSSFGAAVFFAAIVAMVLVAAFGGCTTIDGEPDTDIAEKQTCGNGRCTGRETCETCPSDCGVCAATCGDGVCSDTASGDCAGDDEDDGDADGGICAPAESCATCEVDCGPCVAPTCGDGTCDATEDCTSCPADCGACPASCGDGTCDATEDCTSCPADCGACPASCGDGTCDATEDCTSCPADCGACGPTCEPAAPLPTPSSGNHNPGAACLGCHDGQGAPKWTVAGTLYSNASGSTPVSQATIVVTDARGNTVKIPTALNGNFWTTASLTFPLTVHGTKCPDLAAMNGQASSGNCNSCHGSGFRIHVP